MNVDGNVITTSKVIADAFGKVHRDVTKAIRNLHCSDDFRVRNFTQSTYLSKQNKELDCFNITRDGFSFLCMGFEGEKAGAWKEKYIAAFNEMEKALLNPPNSMAALNELTKKIEEDKEIASKCGSLLAHYKQVKKDNTDKWIKSVNDAQLSLGLFKGN